MDKNMLADATSTDDSPTPGYMLNDIARQTLSSYPACTQLQEFLVSRLQKKHHNIKYKCLVIIKAICRTGRPEFKRDMARQTDAIKECLQFKGPPDPLRGDEIYKRVRDMAKEALDAIFDSQPSVPVSAVASKIQGMGGGYASSAPQQSSTWGPPSGGPTPGPVGTPAVSVSASGMQGFGNPNFSDAGSDKSWYEKATSTAMGAASYVASFVSSEDNSAFKEAPDGSLVGSSGARGTDYSLGYTTNRGVNAYNTDTYNVPQGQGFVPPPPRGNFVSDSLAAGSASSDGSYERQIVNDLCEPGGTKAVPPEDKLQRFIAAAPTLSPDFVGPCLEEAVKSDSWQSVVKAMIVIWHLGKTRGCEAHTEWLAERCGSLVQSMTSDSKTAVRQQALKTVRVFKGFSGGGVSDRVLEEVLVESSAYPTDNLVVTKQRMASVNLLDVDDMVPVSTAPPVPPALESSSGGLFDGMAVGSAPQIGQSMVPEPVSVVQSSFSFMSSSAPAPASPAAPGPMLRNRARTASDPFNILNADVSTPPSTLPPPIPGNDGFGNLVVGNSQPFAANGGSLLGNFASLDLNVLQQPKGMGIPMQPSINMGMGTPAAPMNGNNLAAQNALLQQQLQMQALQLQQMQMMAQGGQTPGGYPRPMMPGAGAPGMGYNPGLMGTSMGSISTVRSVIPSIEEPNSGGSGFSFLQSGGSGSSKQTPDTFNFVNDAMKASKK